MQREDSIGFQLKTISNLIKRRFDEEMGKSGEEKITGVQGWIIAYLFNHDSKPVYQRDIERDFNIRRSSVTGLLQLMEKNGLLERLPVPEDARLKRLVLTEKAVEHHKIATWKIAEMDKRLQNGFSDHELEELHCMLRRIEKNLTL